LVLASLADAGPMRAVEHGASQTHLFRNFALGPTVGASALWGPRGVGARFSLGLGLASFHPSTTREGALEFAASLEGEVQVTPGALEGSVMASVHALSWRWFSVGAFAGVGLQGQQRVEAWTIRLGPELAATLHHARDNFDGVVQVFLRASLAVLRSDVFASQALLGIRVLVDLA
jgi:hypothetical protein